MSALFISFKKMCSPITHENFGAAELGQYVLKQEFCCCPSHVIFNLLCLDPSGQIFSHSDDVASAHLSSRVDRPDEVNHPFLKQL